MTRPVDPSLAARALDLARAALARRGAPSELPSRLLVVDVERQRAILLEGGEARGAWPVSTARAGIGGTQNSYRTPPGWHRVHRRIGEDAEAGCVFASREPTGETWTGEARDDDLILTRILTLDGLEDGVNRGPGHDSLERYIYLHGTNHERLLGRPVSHGCIRLSNADICSLFAGMREGDHVLIAAPASRTIPDPTRSGTIPLCRHRRLGHERARPVPGDDGRTCERQRSRLRSRRARRATRAARKPRHRDHASGRKRRDRGLRRARGVDRG